MALSTAMNSTETTITASTDWKVILRIFGSLYQAVLAFGNSRPTIVDIQPPARPESDRAAAPPGRRHDLNGSGERIAGPSWSTGHSGRARSSRANPRRHYDRR